MTEVKREQWLICKKRLFSIIMSIYNVELYIEEAIQSIIEQSIGFSENVQLILVNDGSTDASVEICENMHKNFQIILFTLIKKMVDCRRPEMWD